MKRTWTGSAFSTNESARSVMVMGISLVCEVALIVNTDLNLSVIKFLDP